MAEYSVLMSVYIKENPRYLGESLDSMFTQTLKPQEIVLVCDGPLTDGLDSVIREREQQYGDMLHVVRLEKNGGLGKALGEGIKHCRNELIARMDSDDKSMPERCEAQVNYMLEHPETAVLGGYIEEFDDDNSTSSQFLRKVPEEHKDIIKFSKRRNPFNHMTVMFRKSAVLSVGGYLDFLYLEDYYLWIRMFLAGYQGHNLKKVLVRARTGKGMIKRRSGMAYAESQKRLFKYMLDQGYITKSNYITSMTERRFMALAPSWLRESAYKIVLRRKNSIVPLSEFGKAEQYVINLLRWQ